jgi:hypothetical protein
LGWIPALEVNGFNRNRACIAHYNGIKWDLQHFGPATPGAFGTFEIERTGLTAMSPYAVVDTLAFVALNINENGNTGDVLLYPNPVNDMLTLQIPNTNDVYVYEILDITGKVIKIVSNKDGINKFDLSNLTKGYYFIKATNQTSNTIITKRFIKS